MRSLWVCFVATVFAMTAHADCLRVEGRRADEHRRKEPITVSTRELLAHAIHRVTPEFPDEARQQKIDGSVIVAIEVNRDGDVTEVRPLSGNALLIPQAEAALRQWRFESFCIDGAPYIVRGAVQFKFRWRGATTTAH